MSWSVPAWFVDPANTSGNASDANTCTTAVAPCVTFAQLLVRWGSRSVIFNQATTITYLSDAPSSDPIQFSATTGQVGFSGSLTFQGALVPVAGPLTLASATARNPATATLTHINVAAHAWTRRQFVVDDTSASAMWVTSDAGGGTANVTTPMLRDGSFGVGTVTAGDTVHVFRPSNLYVDELQAPGTALGVVIQNFTIQGSESLISSNAEMNECATLATFLEVAQPYADAIGLFSNCMADTFSNLSGTITVLGGDVGSQSAFANDSAFDNDAVLENRNSISGAFLVGGMYVANWFSGQNLRSNYRLTMATVNAQPLRIWGPATIDPTSGSQISLTNSGTAAAILLCTGGIRIDGLATAFPWNAATNAFLAATAVTAANIDANTNLTNPATGTRISVQ